MSAGPFARLPAALETTLMLWRYWSILVATTRVELKKRYAGSAFGLVWVVLYPAMLLGVYIFVYMVIFSMRFPGYSEFEYVLYVFCGLIPYLGLWEGVSNGTMSVKQNMHLVKNVMLPIELIPVRSVTVSMVSQMVSLLVVIVLVAWGGLVTPHLLWLPVVLVLQMMFLFGLVYVLAGLAVVLPDIAYVVNLMMLLLLFISPIGFKPEMIPAGWDLLVTLNPVYYMIEMYRTSLLYGDFPEPRIAAIYVAICGLMFLAGCAFFRRFKNMLVDYE